MDLFVRESGEANAPALVFLHGGGLAGWIWDRQAEYFKNYHVIIPDLPGHGESAGIPFVSINDAASKVLTAVMELVGNDRIILVGFSLGAQLVLEIISKWPEKVDSAIISSVPAKPPASGKYFIPGLYKLLYRLSRREGISKQHARRQCIPDDFMESYYRDSLKVSAEDFINIADSGINYRIPESYPRSDVRLLALAGMREPARIKDSASLLVHANRNCAGFLVCNMGRGFVSAEPDLFNEIVYNFINNIQLNRNIRLARIV